MGIAESFRKSKEQEKEHTTPPPAGHTLAEILQDKNKSHLFGELLRRDENEELALRLAEGKLEESDINILEEQRKIFSEKITRSEKVEKLLTKENVIDIARNHPDFEKVINLLGPDKAIRVIQSQLKEISITDEYRFNNIVYAMEAGESYKNGEYKILSEKVDKLLEDKNITSEEYSDALAIKDPTEKKKALKELSGRTYGGFKKALNFLNKNWGKDTTFESLKNSETSLERSLAELNKYQENIGSALFGSVSGNEDMRNALFGELLNEKAPEKPKTGFRDAKRETSGSFNESDFDKDWENYKNKMEYHTSNDSEKDYLKNIFIDEQKEAYRAKNAEGRGFWHEVFASINEALISNKKDKLK